MKNFSLFYVFILSTTVFLGTDISGQQISELDENGNILIDGEPFLPIGFYCEGLPFDEFPDVPERIDLGGFNILYTESSVGELSDYPAFMADCEERDLKNIIGLPYSFIDPDDFDFFVGAFLDYPSLAVWNIMDDANDFSPAQIELQRDNLFEFDNSRLTMASWFTDDAPFTAQLPSIELAGMQAYPWEDGSTNDLVFVESLWRLTTLEAQSQNKFAIATPQAFNWGVETYPPAEHLDCQSYIGFITGMKGIIYYTFRDYDNNSTIDITQPEIFETASQVANEILQTELKDVILFGEYEYFNIDFYRYYATWRHEGYLYLIAVNANDELTYSYNIELPDDVVGEPLNFFDYRPDDLSLSNGNLVGELEPYQVAIYRLETQSLSVAENNENEVKIFPNPTNRLLTITSSSPYSNFTLLDPNGRVLRQGSINGISTELDLSELSSGVFFVRLESHEGREESTHKIILK